MLKRIEYRVPIVKGSAILPQQWDVHPDTNTLYYKFLADEQEPEPTNEPLSEDDIRELRRLRTARDGQWYWEYPSNLK